MGFSRFQKSDRRVITLLAVLAAFNVGVLIVTDALKGEKRMDNDGADRRNGLLNGKEKGSTRRVCDVEKAEQEGKLHEFDPNEVDSATLVEFGLSDYQVRNFLHYREAGAVFHSPQAMMRVYGWDEGDADILLEYAHIGNKYKKHYDKNKFEDREYNHDNPSKSDKSKWDIEREERTKRQKTETGGDNGNTEQNARRKYSGKFSTLTKVDANQADSTTLCSIPGIGKYISKAIIRYRNKLGGFHSVSQLSEISIVSPELLEWFKIENPGQVKKININTASFQALNSHPYISYEQTRDILQYIRLYGKIKSTEQLRGTQIFTDEEIRKVEPYLEY